MASCSSPQPLSTDDQNTIAAISSVHPDILETHIFTRLDGPTLASAACASTWLCNLASRESLWTNICHSTWPSTASPCVGNVISTFPNGPRTFFSDSFPLPTADIPDLVIPGNPASLTYLDRSSELISAVDICYRNELIFSKAVESETASAWFRSSPFRIDLLDPKDTVATRIPHPHTEDTCRDLERELTLSWIVIDPVGRRAMNLSSQRPVSVQRHWLSGEVQVRFASVLPGERGSATELVQCGVVVTCGGSPGGEMRVREVSLQLEDMDGMHLNGKDSSVILRKSLEGKRGKGGRREEEGKRKYQALVERKRGRKERKLRREGALDMLCVAFGIVAFAAFGAFLLWR